MWNSRIKVNVLENIAYTAIHRCFILLRSIPGGLTQVDFRTAWLLPNTQRRTYSSTHGHWFESVLFAIKVLRVIGLFPCQLDHAFEFWPMIKLIAIQSLWYTGRYERCVIRYQGSYVTTLAANYVYNVPDMICTHSSGIMKIVLPCVRFGFCPRFGGNHTQ